MTHFVKGFFVAVLFGFMSSSASASASADAKCYLDVSNPDTIEPEVVRNLSQSLISKYIQKVDRIPRSGIATDECLYLVSVKKSEKTLLVTISGSKINGIGESNLEGYDSVHQAVLKAVYDGSRENRRQICRDYKVRLKKECAETQGGPSTADKRIKWIKSATVSGPTSKGICSMLKPKKDYRHCKLSRKVFRNLNLSGSNFTEVNLERSQFVNCNLADTVFTKANLERSVFINTTITSADFSEADMERSVFKNTTINESNFSGSKLDRANFTSITLNSVILREAKLERAIFRNATLNRVDLSGSDVDDSIFRGATLNQTILIDVDLDEVDFSQTNLNNIIH